MKRNTQSLNLARHRDMIHCLSHTLMALFFGYCTYVQLNDPDMLYYVCFYTLHSVIALLQAFPTPFTTFAKPVLWRVSLIVGIFLLFNQQLPQSLLGVFNVNIESGRERLGILIAVTWTYLSISDLGFLSTAWMAVFSVCVCSCVYSVPTYFLSWNDVKDVPHCYGLGVSPFSVNQ